jgi:hypothetical protein
MIEYTLLHSYGDHMEKSITIAREKLQTLGQRFTLRAFDHGLIFIVPNMF